MLYQLRALHTKPVLHSKLTNQLMTMTLFQQKGPRKQTKVPKQHLATLLTNWAGSTGEYGP